MVLRRHDDVGRAAMLPNHMKLVVSRRQVKNCVERVEQRPMARSDKPFQIQVDATQDQHLRRSEVIR